MNRLVLGISLLGLFLLCACGELSTEVSKEYVQNELANLALMDIPIEETAAGEEPDLTRNVYFIFDGSGSMADPLSYSCGGDREFSSKLEGARWAVQEFFQKLPDDMNIGLYVFDRYAEREVVPLGSENRSAFLDQIQAVEAGGGTPLAESIRYATDRLVAQYQKQLGYGEYRLVVVTDGIADDIPEAAKYAMQRRIPIYAIGLCVETNHPLRQYALSYRSANTFDDLARDLEQTVAELPSYDLEEFEE